MDEKDRDALKARGFELLVELLDVANLIGCEVSQENAFTLLNAGWHSDVLNDAVVAAFANNKPVPYGVLARAVITAVESAIANG